MLQHLVRGAFVFSAMVALVTTTAKAEWKVEYGAKPQWVQNWYKEQKMTDETWKRLGSPSWNPAATVEMSSRRSFALSRTGLNTGMTRGGISKKGFGNKYPTM